jgi:hypothetical protein
MRGVIWSAFAATVTVSGGCNCAQLSFVLCSPVWPGSWFGDNADHLDTHIQLQQCMMTGMAEGFVITTRTTYNAL